MNTLLIRYRVLLIGLAVLFGSSGLRGQVQSSDAKGNGPVIVPSKASGALRFNTEDKSAKLAFISKSSGDTWYFGGSGSGAIENSWASIVNSGQVSPKATAELYLGKTGVFRSSGDPSPGIDWIHFRLGLVGSKIRLVDLERAFAEQVQKKLFTGVSASGSYNRLIGGSTVFSFGAGYERANNVDELTEVEVAVETTRTDPQTGATRKVKSTKTAYQGSYLESNTLPLTLDLFVKPSAVALLGLNTFARQILSDGRPKTVIGAGLWILKEKSPAIALGGLVAQLDDAFKASSPDDSDSAGKRIKVSLVVNLPLFNR